MRDPLAINYKPSIEYHNINGEKIGVTEEYTKQDAMMDYGSINRSQNNWEMIDFSNASVLSLYINLKEYYPEIMSELDKKIHSLIFKAPPIQEDHANI